MFIHKSQPVRSKKLRDSAKGEACTLRSLHKRSNAAMTEERWRPVVGWEGLYEVSNHGRVRSVARWVAARAGRRLMEGRVLSPRIASTGYAEVMLCDGERKAYVHVHRLVARAFVLGTGDVVRHLDGDSTNNRASNLAWGSYQENEEDKRRHGRTPEGLSHPQAKLTRELVLQIREAAARGLSQMEISRQMGINRGAVGKVVRGESYKDVV